MKHGRGKRVAVGSGVLSAGVLALAAWLGGPGLHFWYLFEPLGRNLQGFPEYRHRQTGIVMVRLPGGKFPMGAQKADPNGPSHDPEAEDDEGPVHEVTLSAFLIAKHEVTQGQWKRVMGSNPSEFTGDDDRPVENVSWEDIGKFEARTRLLLPSEAQWECACRATSTTAFAGKLDDLGWFGGNSGSTTHPVGTKAANGFGLHDMHGNVWEWCEDVYDESFYGKPEATGLDPVSTSGSESRVVRGGSWYDVAGYCRSADRSGGHPANRYVILGFRPARPAP